MAWNIRKTVWTRQPAVLSLDTNVFTDGLVFSNCPGHPNYRELISGSLPVLGGGYAVKGQLYGLGASWNTNGNNLFPGVNPIPGNSTTYTVLVVSAPVATAQRQDMWFQGDQSGGNFDQYCISANSDSNGASQSGSVAFFEFSSSFKLQMSATSVIDGLPHVWVGVRNGSNGALYKDGVRIASTTTASGAHSVVKSTYIGGSNGASVGCTFPIGLGLAWNRPLSSGEVLSLSAYVSSPWRVFKSARRRLWFAPQVANNMTGGATLNLSKITEQGTGITGSVGSATDTLKALTEQATGITGTVGSARDTLKALLESAFGKTGAVGFGTETLKPITVQATGTVQSNNVVGGATLTLKALLESATGRTGVVGSARDSLRAITEQGTGKTGSVGSGQIILKPITVQAFGESGATPLAPADTSRPGGQAWWGYESFDGSARPWWYKDLKDKACELERLRQQRIEIGLIPPDKVEETVEEVLEFVEEQPTPATADYYVHKAEMLAARVEKLIDNMMEEDDEQAIMEMSKFFFHRKEARTWQ